MLGAFFYYLAWIQTKSFNMRKLYSTTLFLLCAGLVSAQSGGTTIPDAPAGETVHRPHVKPVSSRGGNTVWSEDFANGIPAGWVVDDQSGICPWVYSTDGSWGNFNGNNATAADVGINSTTGANGFLLCDPDSANHFNFGQPSGTTYQYLDSWIATDAIDCSGVPALKLEFEQLYRFNNSVDLQVQVSNDSMTWTTYNVQAGTAANNTASADPEFVSVNISSVAANQPTVYLRIGWSARVYFWMIDDMAIVEAPSDDMSLDAPYFDDYIEYHVYPMNQLQPLEFSAFLENEGANAQNNVQLQADVNGTSGNIFSGTSAASTWASLDTNRVSVSTTHTPSQLGSYDIYWTVTQDETDLVPGNDSAMASFEVTDYDYARDNGEYQSQYWNGDDGAGSSVAYEYGTAYEIFNDASISQISIYIGPNTDVGTLVYGVMYQDDASGFLYQDQTSDYAVQAADLGAWITLSFNSPVQVTSGNIYVALAGHYGGPDYLYIGRSSRTSPAQTSFLLDGADNTWYYTTRSPMVRIGMQPVGLEEENVDFGLQVYPNPNNGVATLAYELPSNAAVNIEVYDIAGKLVFSKNEGSVPSGQHNVVLDLENLSAGAYSIRLNVNEGVQTQQLIITK